MNEQTRAYIYRILIAIGAVVAGYGLISSEELALWLGVATAVLNIMPAANTSVGAPTDSEEF
jgi:hypothetical protein